MKKRLFAILVSVSLLSTMVLSGCGQNSTDEKVTSGVKEFIIIEPRLQIILLFMMRIQNSK